MSGFQSTQSFLMQLCCRAIRWQQPQHLGCWNGDGLWFGMFFCFPPQTFAYSSHQTVVFWQSLHNSSDILPYPQSFWECLNHLTRCKSSYHENSQTHNFPTWFPAKLRHLSSCKSATPGAAAVSSLAMLPVVRHIAIGIKDTSDLTNPRSRASWNSISLIPFLDKPPETHRNFPISSGDLQPELLMPKDFKGIPTTFYGNTIASDEDMN